MLRLLHFLITMKIHLTAISDNAKTGPIQKLKTQTNQTQTMNTKAFWTINGREYHPTPADLTPGWECSPAVMAGLRAQDPGITRLIGAIVRPLLLATGEQISTVALVVTGCPDGAEWRSWVPVTSSLLKRGEEELARRAAPAPAPALAPAPERENPDYIRATRIKAAHASALPALAEELSKAEAEVIQLEAKPPGNRWARAAIASAHDRVFHLKWIIDRPEAWAEDRARHLVEDDLDYGDSPWSRA